MQIAVIEYARNVLQLPSANSREFDEGSPYKVIDFMTNQINLEDKGGTMRLGTFPCKLEENSKAFEAYGSAVIYERHRHRLEFNNKFRPEFLESGLKLSGLSPDDRLVEIVEIPDHPWFVGVQFHPELKSRPTRPHPLFTKFVEAVKSKH